MHLSPGGDPASQGPVHPLVKGRNPHHSTPHPGQKLKKLPFISLATGMAEAEEEGHVPACPAEEQGLELWAASSCSGPDIAWSCSPPSGGGALSCSGALLLL